VDAFAVRFGDLLVALPAAGGDSPVIHVRTLISRGINIVITMAAVAICRLVIACDDGAAVYTLLI
jgi:hypothetical protein